MTAKTKNMKTILAVLFFASVYFCHTAHTDDIREVCYPAYTDPVTWECHQETKECKIQGGDMECVWR